MSDTYTTNIHRVECPYCGHDNDLSESFNEMLCEWVCGECEKKFNINCYMHMSVSASKCD